MPKGLSCEDPGDQVIVLRLLQRARAHLRAYAYNQPGQLAPAPDHMAKPFQEDLPEVVVLWGGVEVE